MVAAEADLLGGRFRLRPARFDVAPDFVKGCGIDPALTVDGVHLTWPDYQRWARRIALVVAAAEELGGNKISKPTGVNKDPA